MRPSIPFMKTTRSLLLALCSLLAVCLAQATTVIPPTFDQLVAEADTIFQGTVTDVKSEWTGEGGQRHIISYVTVKVEDTLKGNPGDTYTLRMLGGTVDGETMEVSDSPKFQIGDRDILFVQNNGKQFIPLVGIMHGRFQVHKDENTGADVILSNEGKAITDVTKLGQEPDETAPAKGGATTEANNVSKAVEADAFKSAIKQKLAHSDK